MGWRWGLDLSRREVGGFLEMSSERPADRLFVDGCRRRDRKSFRTPWQPGLSTRIDRFVSKEVDDMISNPSPRPSYFPTKMKRVCNRDDRPETWWLVLPSGRRDCPCAPSAVIPIGPSRCNRNQGETSALVVCLFFPSLFSLCCPFLSFFSTCLLRLLLSIEPSVDLPNCRSRDSDNDVLL
jgi:hypothetical protein